MGCTSLGLHRWPMLTCQGVLLQQRSVQLRPNFGSLSSGRCSRGFRACSGKLKTSIRGCAPSAFVVADDKKYGNKQIISITPRLYDYILDNVREPEVIELTFIFPNWCPTKNLSSESYQFQTWLMYCLLEGRIFFPGSTKT